MENLVLYRKYRPQLFSEIVGQEHIVKTLENAISKEMISHAYLFAGPRGSGKTTIARLLAKSANCKNRKKGEFEPCNKCSSCQEMKSGRSMDLIEIDAASHRGIDEIRELRDGIKFSPVKEKYKVFILDESHQLSKDAVNALLKTLEEPPSHAIFILATTEIHKVIPTIISRCQRFDFRRLSLEEIVRRLKFICKKEGVKIEDSALNLIALNSGGSIRDAESLLDQFLTYSGSFKGDKIIEAKDIKELLGVADNILISNFVEFLADNKGKEAIDLLNESIEKGYDPLEFSRSLIRYLRQTMILKISLSLLNPVIIGLTKEEQEKIMELSAKFSKEKIHRALNLFLEAENRIKYSSIPQLPIELAVIDITMENRQD